MYEMKDEYLTGIEQIDREHRRLFEIAEEVYQLRQNPYIPDKYDNIQDVLLELKDYTIQHFAHEEEYMESIRYKHMFMQKVQHDEFRDKLEQLGLEDLDKISSDEVIDEILGFLTDWLVNHILHTDKLIGDVVNSQE